MAGGESEGGPAAGAARAGPFHSPPLTGDARGRLTITATVRGTYCHDGAAHEVILAARQNDGARVRGTRHETKGGYTVTMTVTYGGSLTVVGPYGVTVNAGIGAISVSSSRAYNVIEVRSARD